MNEHTPAQWVQQAQAFAKSGDFSAAVTCLERGSAEHPHNLMLRVNCVAALGQSCQWHKAEAQARAILQVAPEDPGAQFYLGMALLAQGQFEEGWTHYELVGRTWGLIVMRRSLAYGMVKLSTAAAC